MPFAVAAGAAVAIGGAYMQSQAADKASKRAVSSQEAAQAQMRADLAPYAEAGTNALAPQQALLGLSGPEAAQEAMGDFQQSPGYQFQVDEGLRAVNSNASAAGMLGSGATMKALQARGQQLANQSFGEYYGRLNALTTMGQNSAAGVGAAGNQSAAGIAQTQMSNGSAQASIYGNAAQGLGNAIGQGYQNYQYQNSLGPRAENTGWSMYGSGGLK